MAQQATLSISVLLLIFYVACVTNAQEAGLPIGAGAAPAGGVAVAAPATAVAEPAPAGATNSGSASAACQQRLQQFSFQSNLPVVLIQLQNTDQVAGATAAELQLMVKGPHLPGLLTTCGGPGDPINNCCCKSTCAACMSCAQTGCTPAS
jgi:hypothetical protein